MAKRKKLGKLLPILVLFILVGGALVARQNTRTQIPDEPVEEAKTSYPSLYQEEALPEYPNANIVSASDSGSLEDGIRVTLETSDTVNDASSFYEREMRLAGWEAANQRLIVDGLYLGTFTKNGLFYQVTISRQEDGGSQISIVYAEE